MTSRNAVALTAVLLLSVGCSEDVGTGATRDKKRETSNPVADSPSAGPIVVAEAAQAALDERTGAFTSTLSWSGPRGQGTLTIEGGYDLDLPAAEFKVKDPEIFRDSSLPVTASGPLAFVVRDDSLFVGSDSTRWAEVPLQEVGPGSDLMLGFPTDVAASPDMLDLLRNEEWMSQIVASGPGRFEGKIMSRAAISLLNAGPLNWMLNQIRTPADIERAFLGDVDVEVTLDPEGNVSHARVDLTPSVRGMVEVLGLGNPQGVEASSNWTFRELGQAVEITNPQS